MTTRVLVLDANQRSALAVTRSLGRIPDVTVLTCDDTATALAGTSRFSTGYLRSPSPADHPQDFADWLARTIQVEGITQLFPVTEVSTYTCLTNQERLAPCVLPFPSLPTVQALADKCRLMDLARDLDIPHPRSTLVTDAGDPDVRAITAFPAVLKPCLSRIWQGGAWLGSSVHTIASPSEFDPLVGTKPYLRDHPFMIQEFIPGTGAGVFALYDHGQAVTFFSHRRLREKPPAGGVSVLSESTPPDPLLVNMAKRLLDHVKWHGVAMVEFRMAPDGTPYLMEVNPRFWGSLQLAIDCGVDFPRLLFEMNAGHRPHAPEGYTVGRRLRWLLGDLDSLYLCLRDRQRFTPREKLGRVLDFLRPAIGTTRHEVNRLGDLGPARYELAQYLRDLLRLN